jgi:hypothetical protein
LRKFLIPLALLAMLLTASSAHAANVYEVTGEVNGRAGTSSRPSPISVRFDFTVNTDNGQRPAVVRRYRIAFDGLRVNSRVAPVCRLTSTATSDARCSAGSRVGSGFIENATGQSADPADRSIVCNAAISVYNAGNNRATLFIEGDPNSTNPRTRCQIGLAAPIPARFIRTSTGTALQFDVPQNLRHPLTGLDNAVVRVESRIRRITRRIGGRTRGFFESVGGCRGGTRRIAVTFTPETGAAATDTASVPCRR